MTDSMDKSQTDQEIGDENPKLDFDIEDVDVEFTVTRIKEEQDCDTEQNYSNYYGQEDYEQWIGPSSPPKTANLVPSSAKQLIQDNLSSCRDL
jgi:hypothetical protein